MALSTIGTNQVADQVLTHRNLIINGGMNISQRSVSSTANGYGSLDRYRIQYSGAGVTHSQESLSSSDSPYSEGFRTALKLTNTSTSSATSAYAQVFQIIESQNVAGSGWNYTSTSSSITFQFWAKSSLAGTYTTFLRTNDGTAYLYSKDFTLVADTWKKITCTVPGNSNLVFNNDSGAGLDLFVVPHYGTNFTTSGHTDDAWIAYSSSNIAGDYAQSWTNTSSATFFITGVQLEVGEQATPFEHEDIGTTLRKCQRYYVRQTAAAAFSMWGAGFIYTTQQAKINIAFPVEMRDVPSLGQSANNTLDLFTGGGTPAFTQDADINNPSTWATNVTVYCGSGLTAGQGAVIMANNSVGAYLEFKAEL